MKVDSNDIQGNYKEKLLKKYDAAPVTLAPAIPEQPPPEPEPADPGGVHWPALEDAADGQHTPADKPDDLIEGIAFEGSKISLSAPSKGRKTYFQIFIAICIAAGIPIFGRKVKQGRVLYLNLELCRYSFQRRVKEICRSLGVTLPPDSFHVWHLRGQCVSIEQLEIQLPSVCGHGRYVLSVFDPLYKLLGNRDENSAGQMADLLNRMERLSQRIGAAYLVAHHFAKGNAALKSAIDRSSGSGVVARDGDSIITLTPHKEDNCFAMEITCRDHAPIKPQVLRWECPVYRVDDALDPAVLAPARTRATAEKPKDEAKSFEEPAWTRQTFAAAFVTKDAQLKAVIIADATDRGMSANKAEALFEQAEAKGLIFRWKIGGNKAHLFANIAQPELNLEKDTLKSHILPMKKTSKTPK